MKTRLPKILRRIRVYALIALAAGFQASRQPAAAAELSSAPATAPLRDYHFDHTISRKVLENYLSRSISMEGVFNGRGDLDDNIRMLTSIGAKYIGRSLCLDRKSTRLNSS